MILLNLMCCLEKIRLRLVCLIVSFLILKSPLQLWISELLVKLKVRVLNVYGFWIKQAPVLFKGIAHSLNAANNLVRSNVSLFIYLLMSLVKKVFKGLC